MCIYECFFISPSLSDTDDLPYDNYDLPKYDLLSSESPSNAHTDEIEREMLGIAIERSLQSEDCSHNAE